MTTELVTWEDMGKYFGYPTCCIASFVRLEHRDDRGLSDRPLIGTGFVPCKICSQTKTAEQLEAEIALNRECPLPFPEDMFDELEVTQHD